MNKKFLGMMVIAASVALLGSASAKADTLVYDNGPINGTIDAYTLGYGYKVSDSFVVSSATTLTSANAGIWVYSEDSPTNVHYSIGTSAFGSDISTGSSATTDTYYGSNGYGYSIYNASFAISGTVGPGTYWLTLDSLQTTNAYGVGYWDINNGPSAANHNFLGTVASESFQVYGSNYVPEPSSFALLGLGALGLAVRAYRRRQAAV